MQWCRNTFCSYFIYSVKITLQNAVKLSLRNLSYLTYKFLRMGNTIFLFPKCEIRNVSYLSYAILIFIIEIMTILFLCDWNKEIRKIVKISLHYGAWDAHAHIVYMSDLHENEIFRHFWNSMSNGQTCVHHELHTWKHKGSSLLFHELIEMKFYKFYESKVS